MNDTKSARQSQIKVRAKAVLNELFVYPFYILTHPIRGFDRYKRENSGSRYAEWFYVFMMIVVNIIAFSANGFLVNKNNPKDFNVFLIIALVAFPVAIFTLANWASTALMDGKGKMREIFGVTAYAFFPYVWLSLFATVISNFIVYEEIVLFHFLNGAGVLLLGYMLFFGLMGIHEFGPLKTVMMFLFTVIAIAALLFIILLFLSLIQYFFSFLNSVIDEFKWRFW